MCRVGMLANLGAYAWAALAGQATLRLAKDHGLAGLPAAAAVGLALAVANFVVGPARRAYGHHIARFA